MKTVNKALGLLEHFTIVRSEIGLSEMARLSGIDKATVLRLLSALIRHGIVEQYPDTKKYRLGSGLLRLARVREASFPVVSVIQPVLERLASDTGETVHASLASEKFLITVAFAEPQRPTRVHIDPAEPLPFHATASGIAYLAFADEQTVEAFLDAGEFPAFTERTPTSQAGIRRKISEARRRGFGRSLGGLELDVLGIAAPIFDWTGNAYGAISVASVAARTNSKVERRIAGEVVRAAVEITRAMGAEPGVQFLEVSRELAA